MSLVFRVVSPWQEGESDMRLGAGSLRLKRQEGGPVLSARLVLWDASDRWIRTPVFL